MDAEQIKTSFFQWLFDNWPELTWMLLAAAAASFWIGYRARRKWRRREFMDRLNVSLTSIWNGRLVIRTILEMDCQAVFLNKAASEQIISLARKTTKADPIIPFNEDDYWMFLNAVLNEISERFSLGYIQADCGMGTEGHTYILCLTCECDGAIRTRKIRAMMVRKSLLLTVLQMKEPQYENPWHKTRWRTLMFLASEYARHPYRFIEMEICV